MFDLVDVTDLDPQGCAGALDGSVAQERLLGARRLALVVHWADLHPPVDRGAADPHRGRVQGRGIQYGAEGTPRVSEFAVTELGVLLRTTTMSAASLLRDGLNLRHRHPRLWAAVMTGQVEEWKARKVTRATTHLSLPQAQWVDAQVLDAMLGLPFGRALAVVEAKVIAADPAGHEARREAEAERRYVSTGRPSNPAGLRTLIAQTTAGDIARLEAMIDHLATLLTHAPTAVDGTPEPAGLRRAKALALLANPALACVLLARAHRTTPPAPTDTDGADGADGAEPVGQAEPDPEGEPAPEPVPEEEAGEQSAVELAAEFGELLLALGRKAIDRLRPTTVLYLHLAAEAVTGTGTSDEATEGIEGTQVVRVEELGPVGLEQAREWIGTDRVTLQPVLDPTNQPPVDGYEIPRHLREPLQLLHPFEIFPYGTLSSRKADADHTTPYTPQNNGGPPGQTRIDNLGPLARGHHNAKTFGRFTCHQPLPGLYLWRTPTGYWYRVDHTGTQHLGQHVPDIINQTTPHHTRMETAFLEGIELVLAS